MEVRGSALKLTALGETSGEDHVAMRLHVVRYMDVPFGSTQMHF